MKPRVPCTDNFFFFLIIILNLIAIKYGFEVNIHCCLSWFSQTVTTTTTTPTTTPATPTTSTVTPLVFGSGISSTGSGNTGINDSSATLITRGTNLFFSLGLTLWSVLIEPWQFPLRNFFNFLFFCCLPPMWKKKRKKKGRAGLLLGNLIPFWVVIWLLLG